MGYRERILQDGPTSLWMLDETSGTTFKDTVTGATSTVTGGGVTLNATALLPGEGGAALFSTGGGYGQAPDSSVYSPHAGSSGVMTVEAIVKPTAMVGFQIYASKYGAGTYEWYTAISPDGSTTLTTIQAAGTTVKSVTSSVGLLAAGRRSHCVYTYNRATPLITIWVDGVQVASDGTSFNGVTSDTGSGLFFGTAGVLGDGDRYGGSMAAFAIYNRVLTSGEIVAHYREGLRGGVLLGGGYG